MTTEPLRLSAYVVGPTEGWVLEPASPRRAWMDETNGFAYRCLPLTIANQAGWIIRSPASFQTVWNGGPSSADTAALMSPGYEQFANQVLTHFGHGVLTFSIPWLFRTPEGYALRVSGAANTPQADIAPLEGIVETDWAASTFTMNWRLTAIDKIVRFHEGDPICQITPVRVADLERFDPEVRHITENAELHDEYTAWVASRSTFNADPERKPGDWQKDYFKGETTTGSHAREHRSKLKLKPFTDPNAEDLTPR